MSVDLDAIERTMRVLLRSDGRALVYRDSATDRRVEVGAVAAAADGFLPALITAGEAVWREVTGAGFALDIARDTSALLGYRLRGVGAGSFTSVMLAMMEATSQVARPEAIVLSDLSTVWSAANVRIARAAMPARRPASGAQP
ncbi:MAG TPA: hypothetical protein VJY39_02950 [Acidisphaera sp.]|nr:hypothetical protein [Acidisphaera sp.]